MKVIFMGTPEFSVQTLEKIVEHGHEVLAVITQPDKPKGRGKEMQRTAVKEKALQLGIPVYQPVKVKEASFVEQLRELKPDVIVVVAFGQILSKDILDLPKYGCINVHASLLPKYRGAAPIQWSILDGEKETGVTTMLLDAGVDTGDMLMKAVTPIDKNETTGSLHDKLASMGADLLIETFKALENGTLSREKQDDSKSCYAKMFTKEFGKIDFNKSAEEIERLIRGLNPWPSAYTCLDGKTLKIWSADVVETETEGSIGEIVEVKKDALIVKTGNKALAIKELQLEGKKRMTVDAFLRGYPVHTNTILDKE